MGSLAYSVRHKRWYVEEGAQSPFIGIAGAIVESAVGVVNDLGDFTKELSSGPENTLAGNRSHMKESDPYKTRKERNGRSSISSQSTAAPSFANHQTDGTPTSGSKDKQITHKGGNAATATGHLARSLTGHTLKCSYLEILPSTITSR